MFLLSIAPTVDTAPLPLPSLENSSRYKIDVLTSYFISKVSIPVDFYACMLSRVAFLLLLKIICGYFISGFGAGNIC